MGKPVNINLTYDFEAEVFLAMSNDVPGLVVEAPTVEEVIQEVNTSVEELRSVGIPAEAYRIVCGDWRDELYSIHGPSGYITGGLTMEQAKPIIDELNKLST